ncbi:Tkl protein kinase, partial [Globisporangium splendens]
MRTLQGKAWVQEQVARASATDELPDWLPRKKDTGLDYSSAVVRAFTVTFDPSSVRSPPSREAYYRQKLEEVSTFFELVQAQRQVYVPPPPIKPRHLDIIKSLCADFADLDNASRGATGDGSVEMPKLIRMLDYATDLDMKDATELDDRVVVAVKRLHQDKPTKKEKVAFIKEATILAHLGKHDNIVHLIGCTFSPLMLVMDAIEAKMTDGRVKKNITWHRARGSEAAKCAHLPRLPSKVTDFGLARLRAKTATTTASHLLSSVTAVVTDDDDGQDDVGGGAAGTAGYMAPELLEGSVLVSPSSDVYSFGVLLNELIQEEEPYYESLNKFHGKGPRPAAVKNAVFNALGSSQTDVVGSSVDCV